MILIGFFSYFLIIGIIAFSVYLYNKKHAQNNYSEAIIGNRSINYVLTALSAQASDMSDWLFMAFPAAIYGGGLINAWIAIGLVFGMFITWTFIAGPIREETEKYNCYTLSSYFEKRFNDTSGIIRITSALLCVVFFSVYLAAGMKGFGFLAESIFQIPYEHGTLIAICLVVFYVMLGGYTALAWIDCFQALFLFVVIFMVPAVAFFKSGGVHSIIDAAQQNNIPLTFFPTTIVSWINTLIMALSWSVGYFGTPHILTKFMGINDVSQMKKAQYVGMSWQIAVLTAAGLSGLIGLAYFPEMLVNKELLFIEMVKNIFSVLITGFILSAVAGATLSVMTAQVLVLVSIMTEDFYRFLIRPMATDKELLWVYRFSIIIISILSFLVSLDKESSIQSLVSYAWIGFGCAFGPLVLLSLYSKKINKYGAYVTVLIGGIVAIFWRSFFQNMIFDSYGIIISAVVPGFLLSIISAYVISFITKTMLSDR